MEYLLPKYTTGKTVLVRLPGHPTPIVSEELDLNNITLTEQIQFTISGMYPLKTKNKWRLLAHDLQLLTVALLSSILFISMIVALILGVENLSDVTAILYYLVTQTTYIFKMINFIKLRYKLFDIEDLLKDDISHKYYRIFGHKDLREIVNICWFLAFTFRTCGVFTLFFYILIPLIADTVLLPFAGWMPVDKEENRAVIFIMQICCFFVSCFTNLSLDIFATYYLSIGVGELRLLKTCLSNIDYTMDENGVKSIKLSWKESMKMDVEIDDLPKLSAVNLREIILLHKHCMTLVNVIEEMFSNGIFIQFLSCVVTICMSGFQMLIVSHSYLEFLLVFCYFLCMLYQVGIFCYFGNEILFESGNINEAIYMSNWYEAEPRYKKDLFIIMERSKRPIFVTAGKIFILSLTTLMMIGKTSYSYFAVLRRVYED